MFDANKKTYYEAYSETIINDLVKERDMLLEALESILPVLQTYLAYGWNDRMNVIMKVKAAIEQAKGE
jgi:hypothetical protein